MNEKVQHRLGQPDWWLLAITLVLVGIGLLMVFSASGIVANRFQADSYYYFKRQVLFALMGFVVLAGVMYTPRCVLYKLMYPALFIVFLLMLLTLSPLGVTVNGAKRWINVGFFRLQIMEYAKLALVLYLGYFMGTKQEIVKSFDKGVIPPFVLTGCMCVALLLQPDFGGAVILSLLLFFMCFAGGTRFIYLFISAALASGAGYLLVTQTAYRARRLLAFRDPFAVADDAGYQLVQGLYALGSGGLFGVGLGASKQKLFYLPEAHTDFIIAVMGEEIGFLGLSVLFSLFLAFLWRGLFIALRQENLQDRLTAFGLLLVIFLSVLLNLAVVFSWAPPKGVPMPFISYGGNSLIASLLAVGALLNFSRTGKAGA